jgi:hypothetical protein
MRRICSHWLQRRRPGHRLARAQRVRDTQGMNFATLNQPRRLAWLFACWLALPASDALACGVSGPDGVWSCSLAEHDEAERPRWHLSVAGVYTSTALRFGHDLRTDQTRDALLAAAAYAPSARLTLQASLGAAFAGHLHAPDGVHDFSPGPTAAVGVAYRLLSGRPFVTVSAQLSAAFANTHLRGQREPSVAYSAFDLRLGVLAGTTFFDRLSPYALARVFGGPVSWRYEGAARTGTDVSHYQLGVGVSLLVAEWFDLYVEGVLLGERALSAGLGVTF